MMVIAAVLISTACCYCFMISLSVDLIIVLIRAVTGVLSLLLLLFLFFEILLLFYYPVYFFLFTDVFSSTSTIICV